jgi:cytochrome b6-f complex iron-sulfur subunit
MSEPTSTPPTATTGVTATAPAATPAAAPPPPPKVAIPPKPAAAKPTAAAADRREFGIVSAFAMAWIAFTGTMIAMTLGTVRFLFPNVLSEPPTTFRAGDINNYEPNKVDDKFKEVGAWVIRARDERNRDIIYALSTTCTHLGCTPNWLEGDKKFKCPCHGSGFRISGVNFEGPAPRPLERYAIRKTDEGQIIVDKSRKFQKELGQWEDVDSYLVV